MNEGDELISALLLDGRGGARHLAWEEVRAWRAADGPLWVHLHREGERTREWLENQSGVDPWVVEALLAEETRPRVTVAHDALLIILRGVNLNPDSDPEDMVSLRIWLERDRLISTRKRTVRAVADAREALLAGEGPAGMGDLLLSIVGRLVERMSPIINSIEETVDEIEEHALREQTYELRTRLSTLRRQAISLRRYIAPQRDALAQLQSVPIPWMTDAERVRLREVNDRVTRYVEDLDLVRERAAVAQEELGGRLSEQMNATMYRLAVVATVFLPLGLLTGLLGINVGGIPGSEEPRAFAVVSASLLALAAVEVIYFRKRRLL